MNTVLWKPKLPSPCNPQIRRGNSMETYSGRYKARDFEYLAKVTTLNIDWLTPYRADVKSLR